LLAAYYNAYVRDAMERHCRQEWPRLAAMLEHA